MPGDFIFYPMLLSSALVCRKLPSWHWTSCSGDYWQQLELSTDWPTNVTTTTMTMIIMKHWH